MRIGFLLRFFGRLHLLLAALFLIPMLVGLACGERTIWAYLGPSLGLVALGLASVRWARRHPLHDGEGIRRREGFVLVSFSWLLTIFYGSLPYLFSGSIDSVVDAIFESASGFTTTGATVLTNIEALDHGILFWRSFSQWLGGMGIIVLSVAILPELAIGGMQLMSAESTGLGVDKLAPRIAETAKRLWVLYAVLTLVEVVLLVAGPMDLFEAVTHAFATTATGGFSPKNASIGHYDSAYVDTVITVFMFLAGTNFALQYRVFVRREGSKLFTSSEFRLYTAIAVCVTLLVTLNLYVANYKEKYQSLGECLHYGGFQVVSILTTTGFGTADFDAWPIFSKSLIVILMTIGGCAGSTAGGLKIIRLVVVLKHAGREFRRLIYPRMVKPIMVDGKAIDDEILWSMLGFFLLYMLSFLATLILLTCLPHAREMDMDLETATTASLSALNSIGPGLGGVGPSQNFAFVHPFGKLALSFCMVLGRLEIYTLLIIFAPRFWRRQ